MLLKIRLFTLEVGKITRSMAMVFSSTKMAQSMKANLSIMNSKDNGEIYIGEFKKGVKWGEGQIKKENGDIVKGQFKHNNPHGKAEL